MRRNIKQKLVTIAVALGVIGGVSAGLTAPAWAAPAHQICNINANCFNAWNGGPYVRTYAQGVQNNYFYAEGLPRCGNGDYTTSGCPIPGVPAGLFIYQIRYGNSYAGSYNNCVGNDSSNDGGAAFVACNGSNGWGGGYGSVFVAYHSNCPSGSNVGVSSYWTPNWSGGGRGVYWQPDGNGSAVSLNGDNSYTMWCLYQY